MSSAVWNLDLPGHEKFLLLAFADHAHDDGSNAFPSLSHVAEETGLSERQVKRTISILIEKGLLVPDEDRRDWRGNRASAGRGRPTPYRVCPQNGTCLPGRERQEVTPMTPFPSENMTPVSPFQQPVAVEKVTPMTEKVTWVSEKGDTHDRTYKDARTFNRHEQSDEPAAAACSHTIKHKKPSPPHPPGHVWEDVIQTVAPIAGQPVTDAAPLTLTLFESLSWPKGYAAYRGQFPADAADFDREIREKAIRAPDRYFRSRMLETLRGDRQPFAASASHLAAAPVPATRRPALPPEALEYLAAQKAAESSQGVHS